MNPNTSTRPPRPQQPHEKALIDLDAAVRVPAALPDQIYATLKHRILTCSMMPGSRVVEKDLCTEMRVSRTPLREAFNRLAVEGLVSILPFRGYLVAEITLEDFRENCELRGILEPEAAALSAGRATDGEIARLDELVELRYTRDDRRTYEIYLRANSAFHQALVKTSHNSRLEAMVMLALDHHQRPDYLGLGTGMDADSSTGEHRQIVAAIRDRDPDRARRVMRAHIRNGEERIATALKAGGY